MTTQFTIDVVSPQFPCGAAWLANALLELEVPLEHLWGFDTHGEWEVREDGTHRYRAEDLPWRQTLASLRLGRIFRFRTDLRPRFSHAFPWQLALCQRVVLIVRDPRDALYSEWQRHRHNLQLPQSVGFVDFLKQPFFGGPISMVDMLWLHLRCWLELRDAQPERFYILRFEDWKRDPVAALQAATDSMGFHAPLESLVRAAAASDVRHLFEAEQALRLGNPLARQFNRRGMPLEWRETWPAGWFAALGRHWQAPLQALGYATLAEPGEAALSFDLAQVLAWRGLTDAHQVAHWARLLAR